MSLHACTVVTPDHLARARVLARSLREHHPDARIPALVVGDPPSAAEPFEVLGLEALDYPPLEAMIAAHEPFELMCALKPWLLMHLLAQHPAVLYLDSDIRVYAPLDDAAERHALVLTRHLLGPHPRDGRHPTEEDILQAGVYNSGYLGVRRDALGFLGWWAERMAEECTVDPARGLFVDQRWVELAPGLVPDAHVLRDPGVNAGFWDVPNRPLTGGPGGYAVAGAPLRCFHFSGFDPGRPGVLSSHQDRVDLAGEPVLAGLVSDYARELHEAGHAAMAGLRPAAQTALARRLYREGRTHGELCHRLTSRAGEAELAAWLTEPADPGAWAGLMRYLLAFHAASPQLQREFPELDGPGALAYAQWLRAHADRHPDLPAALVPAAIESRGVSSSRCCSRCSASGPSRSPTSSPGSPSPLRRAVTPGQRATCASSTASARTCAPRSRSSGRSSSRGRGRRASTSTRSWASGSTPARSARARGASRSGRAGAPWGSP